MTVFISIFAVLIILGILATAHELGHFFVARMFNVKVYEVAIFVGPPLLKWKKKGIEYTIRCIPIGAYVRFSEIDDNGNEVKSDDKNSLLNQPRWKRLIISLAGPFVNLLLGILIFVVFFMVSGFVTLNLQDTYEGTQLYGQNYTVGDTIYAVDNYRVYTEEELYIYLEGKSNIEETLLTIKSKETGEKYDINLVPTKYNKVLMGITRLGDPDPKYNGWQIIAVDQNQNNGNPVLKVDDILLSVDDVSVENAEKCAEYIANKNDGDVVHVTFMRDDQKMEGDIVLSSVEMVNPTGIVLERYNMKSANEYFAAIKTAFLMPVSLYRMTVSYVSQAFKGDVEIYNVVSGPVGVVNAVDTVVSNNKVATGIKLSTLVMLAGLISVGLTITNMLPLPGLDGFQLVVLVIEMIIGRKLPEKGEKIIAVIGFFVLLILVIFAFASDIAKIVIEGW